MAISDYLCAKANPLEDDALHDWFGPLVVWNLFQKALASLPDE